ncbi:inner ear-specific collagen-like isoform X2 [Lineus longissimus]|uniref:inner ear-specific collagen-like isoform X2 n=1 Tax=Lineus longissimus TaxID=88925 RepID=UPI002B4DC754
MKIYKFQIITFLSLCLLTMGGMGITNVLGNILGPDGKTDKDTRDKSCISDACKCFQGPAGAPGVPGVPGMHGSRGRDGSKGERGEFGQPGLPGDVGGPGQAGIRGKKGNKGDKGDAGAQGYMGNKGEPGNSGYNGLKGAKGEPGQSAGAKIAFSASRGKKLGPEPQDTVVEFDKIFSNVGDGFDVHTSHFVCRHNGTYIFMTHILGQDTRDAFAWIMVNKNHQLPLHGDGRAGYGTGSNTIILHLNVDDHVWIQLNKNSALLNDYSTFSGYLIFED